MVAVDEKRGESECGEQRTPAQGRPAVA
jgi:hypothetical protein